MIDEKSIKHIVRIGNTDLKGSKTVLWQLANIKGIGPSLASAACKIVGVRAHIRLGTLSDKQIETLNSIVSNPLAHGIPSWLVNRKKDPDTGNDLHLLTGDLQFAVENDIKMMKKMKSYKGIRHSLGLPVRGQRTRSNFRRNKGKVLGVSKVKVAPKADSKKGDK